MKPYMHIKKHKKNELSSRRSLMILQCHDFYSLGIGVNNLNGLTWYYQGSFENTQGTDRTENISVFKPFSSILSRLILYFSKKCNK